MASLVPGPGNNPDNDKNPVGKPEPNKDEKASLPDPPMST